MSEMSSLIDVRPQRPDHPHVVAMLDELDRYLASLYPPEENYLLDVQALLSPEVHFVAAWQGEAPVGCGAFRSAVGDATTGGLPYGEIKRMFVRPDCRGQRVGERLLEALEAEQRGRGLTLSLLETGHVQTAAVRLYERCGYARRPAFGGYPDNGSSLFYAKVLRP